MRGFIFGGIIGIIRQATSVHFIGWEDTTGFFDGEQRLSFDSVWKQSTAAM